MAKHKPKPWQNVESGEKPGQPRELTHKQQCEQQTLNASQSAKAYYEDLDNERKSQQLLQQLFNDQHFSHWQECDAGIKLRCFNMPSHCNSDVFTTSRRQSASLEMF